MAGRRPGRAGLTSAVRLGRRGLAALTTVRRRVKPAAELSEHLGSSRNSGPDRSCRDCKPWAPQALRYAYDQVYCQDNRHAIQGGELGDSALAIRLPLRLSTGLPVAPTCGAVLVARALTMSFLVHPSILSVHWTARSVRLTDRPLGAMCFRVEVTQGTLTSDTNGAGHRVW